MKLIRKENSIKKKLLRALRVVILAGLASSYIFAGVFEYNAGEQRLREDILVLGNILGNRSIAALVFSDKDTAETNLSAVRFHPSIDLICLYKKDNKLLSDFVSHATTRSCSTEFIPGTREKNSEFYSDFFSFSVYINISDHGERLGSLIINGNKESLQNHLLQYGLTMLLILTGAWFVMSFIAKEAVQRILEPMDELYSTAKAITESSEASRRAQKLSNDEIGEMVDVFNNMLDKLARDNQALFFSEQKFRTLTSNAPIGIFQKQPDGTITYANEKWYEILGLQQGYEHTHINYLLNRDRRRYQKFWNETPAINTTIVFEYSCKNAISGEISSLMEYMSPLIDVDGEVTGFIGTLVDVTDLKNAQAELEKLAFYDPLTNLPNRRFFRDHLNYVLDEPRRDKTQHTILMLDLDNFKKVNDSLGHDSGDLLLKSTSDRIHEVIPKSSVFSRMGGDEFLFLLPDTGADDAAIIAQSILDSINEPVEISGHNLEITGSIGISIYPDDGNDSHDLLKNADMALYSAKDNGRGQINFYSSELDKQIKENMRLESKLISAINNEILDIYLQPYYSTELRKTTRAEALLRWKDDRDVMIPPGRFIPLAENLGIMHKLGQWVIEQTCYHLTTNEKYLVNVDINSIAVNLSARQFYSRNFLPDIRRIFRETGVKPEKIEFELTESMVMDDSAASIKILTVLRDFGCRISIDDFGTGYSSLSYLKRFPITALKIDRSFVKDLPNDINAMEICTAIIAMAHKLGLYVIAEGIETVVQRDFLIEQGCEFLQGYLFSEPMDINFFIKNGRLNSLKIIK